MSRTKLLSIESKFYVSTLVCGVVPLGACLPIYVLFPEYQFFMKFLVVLPLFAMVIWAFMSIIADYKGLYNVLLMLICVTIALPIGFLYPMINAKIFPELPMVILISILGLIPLTLLSLYLIPKFKTFFKSSKEEKLKSFKSLNCYYPTLYLIMISFVFGEGALIYFYCLGQGDENILGGLLGMVILLVFAYSISSLSMQHKVDTSLNTNQKSSLKSELQILGGVICLLIVPVSIIIIYALAFLGNVFIGVMKSLAIGVSLLLVIHFGLLDLKFRFSQYSQLVMIIANTVIWILFIIPMCIILPISLALADSKTQNKYIGLAIVYLGAIIMIIVTACSIIYNILQRKMEEEKLKHEICEKTRKEVRKIYGKCEEKIMREIYERYTDEKVRGNYVLKIREEFAWDDYQGEAGSVYHKEIVTSELFKSRNEDKIKKKSDTDRENAKASEKKNSFWLLLRCFENYPDELTEKAPPIIVPYESSEHLFAIEESQLSPISPSEFGEIRPPILNYHLENALKSEYPPSPDKVSTSAKDLNRIKSTSTLADLKTIRSARIDWLNAVFIFIANEPSEISQEPWLAENMLFKFCRYGGITEDLVSDVELRLLYTRLTQSTRVRVINSKIFVNELIPALGDMLYRSLGVMAKEVKLVTEVLYPFITLNSQRLIVDVQGTDNNERKDILQRSFTRTLTQNRDRNLDSEAKSQFRGFTEGFKRANSGIPLINSQSNSAKTEKGKGLLKCFNKCGKPCVNFGKYIGRTLENKFNSMYTTKPAEIKIEAIEEPLPDPEEEILVLKEWPEVCDIIIQNFIKGQEEDKVKKQNEKFVKKVRLNFSNSLSIFFKIIEIVQLSASGFKKEVNWNIFVQPFIVTSTVDAATLESNPYTMPIFWGCFGAIIVYGVFAYTSIDELEKSKLGRNALNLEANENENSEKKENESPSGFKEKVKIYFRKFKKVFLTSVGGGFYIFILKSQLNFFACDINSVPPVVWRTDIECYTTFHIGHLVGALVGLAIYYPIATFTFPLLQFNNADLDLKLNPTYLIILSQSKLLVSGLKVFLPFQLYFEYQLLLTSIILMFLGVYTMIEKPSGVNRMVLWTSFGYFFSFLTNFFGFLSVKLDGNAYVTYAFFACTILTCIAIFAVPEKNYGFVEKKKSEKVSLVENSLISQKIEVESQDNLPIRGEGKELTKILD